MATVKVYSDADGDLFVDFSKVAYVKKHSMISVPLEPGQYFIRINTRNPLLYKEEIVNVVGDSVFYAKKEDFVSKLTDTQLNSMLFVRKQQNKVQWVEELYSGLCISNEYDKIGTFQDGMCVVWKNKLCGFINKRGEEVIPCKYEDFGLTRGGLSTVKLNNKWGAVDSRGEFKIPLQYDFCGSRKNDDFWDVSKGGVWKWDIDDFYYVGGKWGLCDRNGKEIVACMFADTVRVDNGFFIGRKERLGSGVTVIKPNGDYLFSDITFEELRLVSEDASLFRIQKDGKWGIIESSGRFVCSPKFDSVDDFTDDLCLVKMNDKWGIVNKSGSFAQPCIFDKIERDTSTGRYIVQMNKQYGALDTKANMVLQCQYERININNPYYIVKSTNFYGVTDSQGSFIIPIENESIERKDNSSYFICKRNGRYGVIDYRGEIRIPFSYSSISGPYEDTLIVGVQDSYGLLSLNGGSVTGLLYETIKYRDNLGFCFKLNGLWGVMNKNGKVIFPARYYFIGPYCNGLFPVNIGGREPKIERGWGGPIGLVFPGNVEGGQWGFIDCEKEIIPPQLDACFPFGEQYTVIMKNRQMGVVNKTGEVIVPMKFSFCKVLSNTLFLTAEGSRIIEGEDEYESFYGDDPAITNMFGMPSASHYRGGRFEFFVKEGKYGVYSLGKEIVPPIYDSIKPNADLTLFVVKKDGKYGVIDKTGYLVVDCVNDSLSFV